VHLAVEIQESVDVPLHINANNVSGFIAQVNSIKMWPTDQDSKNLKDKFDAVSSLYATLTLQSKKEVDELKAEAERKEAVYTEHLKQELANAAQDRTVIRPSEKVTNFCHQLNGAHEVIKMHRDPAWMRYTTNAVTVLGIILTGILPGLAVLGIMALIGKSPKFWESAGQTFFTNTVGEIETNVPESPVLKAIK
jgi:hypothetical protein